MRSRCRNACRSSRPISACRSPSALMTSLPDCFTPCVSSPPVRQARQVRVHAPAHCGLLQKDGANGGGQDACHGGTRQIMRRKLSHTEHIVEGNIVYFVRLEGSFSVDQFRSALSRVQRKHPALRTLIREQPDGLYYEADSAPEIPLRIVPRVSQDDYQRERQTELRAVFAYDQPQLRAVWLRSERESDLLLTTSHRVCDGMSMLTIVREVLRSLHTNEELIPYQPITLRDLVGDYQPSQPRNRKLSAGLMDGILRLRPDS